MSAGFSPAPWHVFGCDVIASDGKCVAADTDLPQSDLNARLIGAAPDLLSIAKRWAALDGGDWDVVRHAREKDELLADTSAAISRATGEPR